MTATGELTQAVGRGLTIGRHVRSDRFAVVAGFLSGLALNRFLALMGVDLADRGRLDGAAAGVECGAGGIRVDGVRRERSSVSGIGLDPSPPLLWRAVLEAVSRERAASGRTSSGSPGTASASS